MHRFVFGNLLLINSSAMQCNAKRSNYVVSVFQTALGNQLWTVPMEEEKIRKFPIQYSAEEASSPAGVSISSNHSSAFPPIHPYSISVSMGKFSSISRSSDELLIPLWWLAALEPLSSGRINCLCQRFVATSKPTANGLGDLPVWAHNLAPPFFCCCFAPFQIDFTLQFVRVNDMCIDLSFRLLFRESFSISTDWLHRILFTDACHLSPIDVYISRKAHFHVCAGVPKYETCPPKKDWQTYQFLHYWGYAILRTNLLSAVRNEIRRNSTKIFGFPKFLEFLLWFLYSKQSYQIISM